MIDDEFDISIFNSLNESDKDEVLARFRKKKDEIAYNCEMQKIEAEYNLEYLFEDDD